MDHPQSNIVSMLLGSLGAVAPEIVRFYGLRETRVKFSLWYFAISAVYAGLGGVMAIALQASTWYSALYIGATLPTVISTMTKTRHRYPKNKDIIRASEPQVQKLSFRELVRSHSDGLFR
jgi:hypothetical protein